MKNWIIFCLIPFFFIEGECPKPFQLMDKWLGNSFVDGIDANSQRAHFEIMNLEPGLQLFLENLSEDIAQHHWYAVLRYFDKKNYHQQRKQGIEAPQYLIEGLGLSYGKPWLRKVPDNDFLYNRLECIAIVRFTSVEYDSQSIIIHGYAYIEGEYDSIKLYMIKRENDYIIEPPVG